LPTRNLVRGQGRNGGGRAATDTKIGGGHSDFFQKKETYPSLTKHKNNDKMEGKPIALRELCGTATEGWIRPQR